MFNPVQASFSRAELTYVLSWTRSTDLKGSSFKQDCPTHLPSFVYAFIEAILGIVYMSFLCFSLGMDRSSSENRGTEKKAAVIVTDILFLDPKPSVPLGKQRLTNIMTITASQSLQSWF